MKALGVAQQQLDSNTGTKTNHIETRNPEKMASQKSMIEFQAQFDKNSERLIQS